MLHFEMMNMRHSNGNANDLRVREVLYKLYMSLLITQLSFTFRPECVVKDSKSHYIQINPHPLA